MSACQEGESLVVQVSDTGVGIPTEEQERISDDYITKPFSHIELVARVQTVLRRVQGLPVTG